MFVSHSILFLLPASRYVLTEILQDPPPILISIADVVTDAADAVPLALDIVMLAIVIDILAYLRLEVSVEVLCLMPDIPGEMLFKNGSVYTVYEQEV